MTRLVQGADGRPWTVRGRMSWKSPATADDFELDVSGGHGPGVVMIAVLIALVVVLLVWLPDQVVIPQPVVFALIVVALAIPGSWAMRRPWTLVAETPGDFDEHPPEKWVGTVRGVFRVRQVAARVSRSIEVYSLPDIEGPLQPVD